MCDKACDAPSSCIRLSLPLAIPLILLVHVPPALLYVDTVSLSRTLVPPVQQDSVISKLPRIVTFQRHTDSERIPTHLLFQQHGTPVLHDTPLSLLSHILTRNK